MGVSLPCQSRLIALSLIHGHIRSWGLIRSPFSVWIHLTPHYFSICHVPVINHWPHSRHFGQDRLQFNELFYNLCWKGKPLSIRKLDMLFFLSDISTAEGTEGDPERILWLVPILRRVNRFYFYPAWVPGISLRLERFRATKSSEGIEKQFGCWNKQFVTPIKPENSLFNLNFVMQWLKSCRMQWILFANNKKAKKRKKRRHQRPLPDELFLHCISGLGP